MKKIGHVLVIELSGCRLNCKTILQDCVYGCISNPGKKTSIPEILNAAKTQQCTVVNFTGSFPQTRELYEKLKVEAPGFLQT